MPEKKRGKLFSRKKKPPGSSPGTLVHTGEQKVERAGTNTHI